MSRKKRLHMAAPGRDIWKKQHQGPLTVSQPPVYKNVTARSYLRRKHEYQNDRFDDLSQYLASAAKPP